MHSLEILDIDKRLWLPENLGECDRRQYLDMAKLIFMYQIDDINYEEFRVQAVYALLNHAPYRDWETDRKSTRLNSSHSAKSRMPSSA